MGEEILRKVLRKRPDYRKELESGLPPGAGRDELVAFLKDLEVNGFAYASLRACLLLNTIDGDKEGAHRLLIKMFRRSPRDYLRQLRLDLEPNAVRDKIVSFI